MNLSEGDLKLPWATALVLVLALLLSAVSGVSAAPRADAAESFGVGAFSSQMSETQAGGHPDLTTSITLDNEALGNPIQQLKDVEVELPSGLSGSSQAIPQCTSRQLQTLKCPLDSQIGVIEPLFVIACRGVGTTLGAGGFISAPPTALTEAVSAGAGELPVESTAGIESGDILTVGSGSEAREATVASVIDATHLRLTFSIEASFPAGTTVADRVISVADTTGFCGGSENGELTIGSGADAEVAHIAFVLSPTRLALEAPLEKPHSLGEPVTHLAEVVTAPFPLYNLEPGRGHLATLGSSFLLGSIIIQLDQRQDGNGIEASISDLTTLFGIDGARFTLWGVPADASHDAERCTLLAHECSAATVEPRPFISAPAQCSDALTTNLRIDSWQEPGRFETASSSQPPPTGCDRLRFSPTLAVTPDTTAPDSPAGYTVDLRLPREPGPLALEGPALESIVISLPPGVSLSPPGAAGLRACAHAQFEAGACPAAASVGAASLISPALAAPLEGRLYAATPRPGVPFGIFLTASSEALTVKLEGRLELDPTNGRVTIVFHDLPQLPLSEMKVGFPGGPAAPLANPAACGSATTTSRLVSSAGQAAGPSSSFVVSSAPGSSACSVPGHFAPRFSAGMTDSRAGAAGTFELDLGREDGEGDLGALRVKLPPGLLANFSAVSPCSSAHAEQGDCPSSAVIGRTDVVVGAGGEPLDLPGTVYLTGPYAGGPFGLAIIVPAAAGPFELGTIVVRASVLVNPRNLRVTIATDPLPQVVGGVQTRIRAIHLRLDRHGFLFNPTSCSASSVAATVWSAEGVIASPLTPFSVRGCHKLGFAPRLRAGGNAGDSRRGAGLAIRFHLGSGPDANLESLALRLPRQLHPRLDAIRRACPLGLYRASPGRCPTAAEVGRLSISSPLLGSPLEGAAYLVAPGGSRPPTVAASLSSGEISLKLEGRIRLNSDGVTTLSFSPLPDVPVGMIGIDLPRTANAVLGTAGSLCVGPRPNVGFRAKAQNGARLARTVAVTVEGCPGGSQGRRAVPSR